MDTTTNGCDGCSGNDNKAVMELGRPLNKRRETVEYHYFKLEAQNEQKKYWTNHEKMGG